MPEHQDPAVALPEPAATPEAPHDALHDALHDAPTVDAANPAPDASAVTAPAVTGQAETAQAASPVEPAQHLAPAECAARLASLFPALFGRPQPLPLKLRIQADIQQRAPGAFTKKSLSGFLQRYTTATAYLKVLVAGRERFDLDGAPAGEVADEHRDAAVAELTRRRALHDERRAAERQAQRQAQEESRRAWQADQQARQGRVAVLRAFETTTLTRANFCALKQIPEAELDALLAQARLERQQEPPAPVAPRPPQRAAERRPGDDRRPPGDRKFPPRRPGPRPPPNR